MEHLDHIKESAQAVLEFAAEVTDWYWSYGVRRRAYKMTPAWLLELYEKEGDARAACAALERQKFTAAVWGPSQAGKSTLLSQFIDAADSRNSALDWPGEQPFRFTESPDFPEVKGLNPFNYGGDASGCVTRFYSVEAPPHSAWPVEISLASRSQILQALAAGYLTECSFEDAAGEKQMVRSWDADNIEEIFAGKDAGASPSRNGFEVLLDIILAVDSFLLAEEPRYQNLKVSDAWRREIVPRMAASAALASSPDAAFRAGFNLLWDNRQKMNGLFARLEAYRSALAQRINGRRIYCSLEFASMLLDIDSFSRFYGKDASQSLDRLGRIAYRQDENALYIDIGNGGERLFNDAYEFGFMQALVWELAIPLSRSFLKRQSTVAADFLDKFDLLDVPGVAQKHQGAQSTLLYLEAQTTTDKDILTTVLKRGKTATIINRYARDTRIDLLLLLVRAAAFPAQPRQLISGVRAIWRARKPDYYEGHGKPPVPVVVGLTFFSKIINQVAESAGGSIRLEALDGMVSQLGPILQKGVSRLYATTYPQFAEGRLQVPPERTASVLQRITDHPWIGERFASAAERGSIAAVMNGDDGGVSYLLQQLASLDCGSRLSLHEERLRETFEAIVFRVTEALPKRDEDAEKSQRALLDLHGAIERASLNKANGADVDRQSQQVSWLLRRLFSFQAADFEPIPIRLGQKRARALEYAQRQLSNWCEREPIRTASIDFCLPQDTVNRAFDAIRVAIDVNKLSDFCVEILGDIDEERMAAHARRYFAAKCACLLDEAANYSRSFRPAEDLVKGCEPLLQAWETPNGDVTKTMHFEKVIAPQLEMLKKLAACAQGSQWEPQPGDEAIEDLWRRLNNRA